MTITEILEEAYDLVSDPAKWTQAAYARNEKGGICEPTDPEAVCFCPMGAVQLVLSKHQLDQDAQGEKGGDLYREIYDRLSTYVPYKLFMNYNDDHTHPEMMKIFRRAINHDRLRGFDE